MAPTKKELKPITKPEDKEWLSWYNNLSSEEHLQHMKQLGLSKEDLGEVEFLDSTKQKKKKD